jgi:hypothetical protein
LYASRYQCCLHLECLFPLFIYFDMEHIYFNTQQEQLIRCPQLHVQGSVDPQAKPAWGCHHKLPMPLGHVQLYYNLVAEKKSQC